MLQVINHPPIGILITDGQSNDRDLTLAAADRVHAEGISMYTFGIGNTNDEELQAIASAPLYEYSFYISSFNASGFDQRVLLLTRQTCSSGFCMPVHVYASYNYTFHKDTIYTVHVILDVYVINALYSVYACVLQTYRYNACVHVFKVLHCVVCSS